MATPGSITPILSNIRPTVSAKTSASFRTVSVDGLTTYAPGKGVINGTKSRDPNNTGYVTTLRSGLLLAKYDGKYATWGIGSLASAAAASATSFTVSTGEATEIVRRVGTSGTLRGIGPPTAAGTVANISITFSAVNTSTGVVTCSALSAALVAGSVIAEPNYDTPITYVPESKGVLLPEDGTSDVDSRIPISALVDYDQLLPAPTDASLKTWIKQSMSTLEGGKFAFDDNV